MEAYNYKMDGLFWVIIEQIIIDYLNFLTLKPLLGLDSLK
jgi:hypothetical protein